MTAQDISRFISTINAISAGMILDEVYAPISWGDLANGQHRNPIDDLHYFTTTFFHHPQ